MFSDPSRFLEKLAALARGLIGSVTHDGWRGGGPSREPMPSRCATRGEGIPDGRVVAEIVSEICAAAGLVHGMYCEMTVEVAEVNDVRAAAEGAEGRSARLDLRGGG